MNGPLHDETCTWMECKQDMVEQLLQCYQKRQAQSSKHQNDSSSIARIKLMWILLMLVTKIVVIQMHHFTTITCISSNLSRPRRSEQQQDQFHNVFAPVLVSCLVYAMVLCHFQLSQGTMEPPPPTCQAHEEPSNLRLEVIPEAGRAHLNIS